MSQVLNDNEKKFVIKDSFENILNLAPDSTIYGGTKYHYNIPWRFRLKKTHNSSLQVSLGVPKFRGLKKWCIDAKLEMKIMMTSGQIEMHKMDIFKSNDSSNKPSSVLTINNIFLSDYLEDGNFDVECVVKIQKVAGIQMENLRKFDESMKKFSDMVLVVDGQKFYVNKMYLASHSPFFESLFLGNFDESKKTEIELKDTERFHFQKFLEVLYGEPVIDDDTVAGILKLADTYDSRTAIRQCEQFLMSQSENSLKMKFNAAVQYGMDELKEKCMSEIKTPADFLSVVPESADDFDPFVWKELFLKSHGINK